MITKEARKRRVDELCRDYATEDRELPNLIVDLEETADRLRRALTGAAEYIEEHATGPGAFETAATLRRTAGR